MAAFKLPKGLVQVYTGDGKGKTTAALGLALRAMGHGLRVYFAQFLKPARYFSGELGSLRKFPKQCRIVRCDLEYSLFKPLSPQDRDKWEAGILRILKDATESMKKGRCDLVILDEINNCMHKGLVPVAEIVRFVRDKPENVEVVLTGRHAPRQLLRAADLVSRVEMVKHPFKKGVYARKGIEY